MDHTPQVAAIATAAASARVRGTRLPANGKRRIRRLLAAAAVSAVWLAGICVAADQAQAGKPAPTPTTTQANWNVPLGTMYSVVDQVGARALWKRGFTGKGVNVAVVDTGVAPVAVLSGSDKVVAMVDLSAEAGIPEARFVDTYGHGTHMAGIIAGRDPGADPATAWQHPEWFLGVAPDAGIVSVKVGDNTGAADITQVIAGIDWVVDHAAELDIRVLNLAYSSGSPLGYETDPLAFAVERAWEAGIVVVVAAGNDDKQAGTLASPARDPFVIAVGAVEAEVWPQIESRGPRYFVPWWATSGNEIRRPDIAAPGAHIDSLRAPLSRVDLEHPEGYVNEKLFRGSGSSQASAVVAGAAALLLDARPGLTPDQVKALMMSQARQVMPVQPFFSGNGVLALDLVIDRSTPVPANNPPRSDGSGSIEAVRTGQSVDINGEILSGEMTVLGTPWVGARWSGARWTEGTWDGARWSGGTWMGARWSDASWSGARWSGATWSGARWSGARWSDAAWSGSTWSGARWSGARWSDSSWTGLGWDGAHWSSVGWN